MESPPFLRHGEAPESCLFLGLLAPPRLEMKRLVMSARSEVQRLEALEGLEAEK